MVRTMTRAFGEKALCRGRTDLPWQDEKLPNSVDLADMQAICLICPVFTECGRIALSDTGSGGFWASVWIPWPTMAGSDRRVARDRARAMLRRKIADKPLSESPA